MMRLKCYFCEKKIEPSFKEINSLKGFLSERGKIYNREQRGLCQKHQRRVAKEIKRARHLALLPFLVRP